MYTDQPQILIRKAEKDDAFQIAQILVEDWKTAYRGIIDDAYLLNSIEALDTLAFFEE